MKIKMVGFVAVFASLVVCSGSWGATPPAPSSFTLSARGKVSQGVTVKPVMKKQRVIGLVVFKQPNHTQVGTVLLGTFSGHPSIHWNLKVGSKTLGTGKYEVDLRVFKNGKPSNIPGPPPTHLVISGSKVHVS
jgi:hypothetical protein